MEPVSILSAASAISAVAGKAYELGSFLRQLCQGAKTVDARVRRLESAVTELARACEHVQGQFGSMSSSASIQTPTLEWDIHQTMITSIERQVKDCRRTLKELSRLLIDLRPGSSSFFGRTSRHIKLQDRGEQIDEFGTRVKTHTDALQMSLQIVTIKIALATPDFLLQQLAMALEDLRARLSRIETKVDRPGSREDAKDHLGGLRLDIARETLRQGATLYEASVAGSVVDVESATGNERASRIREWADSVDVLRQDPKDASGIHLPRTASAHVSADKQSCEDGPVNASSPESSGSSCPESQSDSNPDTISVEIGQAAHDISHACNREKLSIPYPPKGDVSMQIGLTTTDGAEHISKSGEMQSEAANTAKHKLFKYPMHTSEPLDQSTRRDLIRAYKIEITGEMEARICTGEHIKLAVLSQLLVADQAASTVQRLASTGDVQQGQSGLALLLAVYFRDLYLIKPLIELGYLPNAKIEPYTSGYHTTPIGSALARRCAPVIQELLNNGARLPNTCGRSPSFQLLDHRNLRRFPPTSIGSIKRVIDLLMPARSSKVAECLCKTRWPILDIGACHSLIWCLMRDACNMPPHLSRYRMPLLVHLLEYLVSKEKSTRVTSCTPLYNAVISDSTKTVRYLLENAEEALVHTWLQDNKQIPPLELAIRRAKNFPGVRVDIVRMLLEKGADLEAKPCGKSGIGGQRRLRDVALDSQRDDLIALVKTYGKAPPRNADRNGR